MLQVVSTSGVAAANRALLEMTLQDVTSAEGVLAQMTLVGSLASVCVTSGVCATVERKCTYVAKDGASDV